MALSNTERKTVQYSTNKLAVEISTSDSKDVADKNFNMYIGTGGDLKIGTAGGSILTLKNIQSGTYVDWINVRKIYAKGTTAKDIVAIY
tara:strand:+ start:131 stop:397 length:267 start_codon:yes stop_codon:yes gene_type:complete